MLKRLKDRRLFALMKFGERKYLESMRKTGALHMKRLRAFQDIEHKEIGDKNEGISHTWQPDKIRLEVNGIKLERLVGPIRIVDDHSYNPHIFCMYAITDKHLKKQPISYIDKRCLEFGDSVLVITDGTEFLRRIVDKHKTLGGKITSDLVAYVSYDGYSGEMGPFKKFDYHSHQSEYRLVYESKNIDVAYDYVIGSLEDIAEIYSSNEINELIEILD